MALTQAAPLSPGTSAPDAPQEAPTPRPPHAIGALWAHPLFPAHVQRRGDEFVLFSDGRPVLFLTDPQADELATVLQTNTGAATGRALAMTILTTRLEELAHQVEDHPAALDAQRIATINALAPLFQDADASDETSAAAFLRSATSPAELPALVERLLSQAPGPDETPTGGPTEPDATTATAGPQQAPKTPKPRATKPTRPAATT